MMPTTRVLHAAAQPAAQPFAFAPIGAPPPPTEPEVTPDEAFAEGLAAGRAEAEGDLAALQARVEALTAEAEATRAQADGTATLVADATERLQKAWHDAVAAREADLAALALDAAEAVLDVPLSAPQRVAVADAISEAVDALASGAPITVELHPVDLLHLQECGLADSIAAAHPGLRWEPDAAFAEGDWAVSTPEAAVRRLRAAMLTALRDRLGLDA